MLKYIHHCLSRRLTDGRGWVMTNFFLRLFTFSSKKFGTTASIVKVLLDDICPFRELNKISALC